MKNDKLEKQVEALESPGFEKSLVSNEMYAYYTGLPSQNVFDALMELITPHLRHLYSNSGNPKGPGRQLLPREEFLLVLMRLRLCLQEKDLQYRFRLSSHSRVSKILSVWIPFLAMVLQPLMPWPSRKSVLKNMPTVFKDSKEYRRIRAILDCAKFEMESPSALSLNAMTYSDYKGRNTVKVLYAVTPDGYISFVSPAYGGSISDHSIPLKSGLLDMCSSGDDLMADKGFTISNTEVQPRGLRIVLPPFRYGQASSTQKEVETTKAIANLRIIVENCIMRTRYYRILRNRFPVSSVHHASDIVRVCTTLTNLRHPIR